MMDSAKHRLASLLLQIASALETAPPSEANIELVWPDRKPMQFSLNSRDFGNHKTPDGDEAELGQVHRAILIVLDGLATGERMTGEEIADACDPPYSYGGRFKSALSLLVKHGKIINHQPGYSLKSAGNFLSKNTTIP